MHGVGDQSLALAREAAARSEQGLQQCLRRLDAHHGKTKSSGGFGKPVTEEEEEKNPGFFARQFDKAKDLATQAVSGASRKRGLTQKKT